MSGRVWAIVVKEFQEYRRNKLIILTMTLLPVLFLLVVGRSTFTIGAEAPATVLRKVLGTTRLVLLLIPMLVPTTIGAYSVIGEREQGMLEPILTTPATDGELLAGKAFAPLLPAVGLSWLLYILFLVGAQIWAPPGVLHYLSAGIQIVAEIVLVPALAGFAIMLSLLISARSSDIRVAQQLSALASIPVFIAVGVTSFQTTGWNIAEFIAAAAGVLLLDGIGLVLTTKAFSRERLLSRYRD